MTTIHWFRNDLRVSDNPALSHAASRGDVLPIYILDSTDRPLGGANRWWLNHSLKALKASLGGLVVLRGDPLALVPKLIKQTGAKAVTWTRCYEPHAVQRDRKLKARLKDNGIDTTSFGGHTLAEPWQVKTQTGGPFKVFTPFFKALKAHGFPQPRKAPAPLSVPCTLELGQRIDEVLPLPNKPDWADGWQELWSPGETGAQNQLERFVANGLNGYGTLRDRPDLPNVSRLSPHLHFGEISPRQVVNASQWSADRNPALQQDADKLVSELGWRDFSNHLIFHFPEIVTRNWKPAFDDYPWAENAEHLTAWQTGMTGYPLVDAGMRELWQTGYMHNRVRMVAASFLVKHLRIHWREGERWFWDTLVDADLPNNCASWQWVTGCGADAAPYFRIFNPFTQGQKFDPDGTYVRKWCPELARVPNRYLHAPHEAPAKVLWEASVRLGETYPVPIVDHKQAREAALSGYEAIKPPNHG